MVKSSVATVLIQSKRKFTNSNRLEDLCKIVDNVAADLFVFPAGYFSAGRGLAKNVYQQLEKAIDSSKIVCFGVDGRVQKPWPKDQTALAIVNSKIIACGRKFYSAPVEKGLIKPADSYNSKELDYSRVFKNGNKSYYLAVCYDSFGIRKNKIPNPGIDIVINNVHAFYPQGQENSGESYFARHGSAGLSKQWKCPVFSATVFFDRNIPTKWPTGVEWNQGDKSTLQWSYNQNPLQPVDSFFLEVNEGTSKISVYEL